MYIYETKKNGEKIEIVCKSESTRSGFRHLATVYYHGYEFGFAKKCYYNRTWERYNFESAIHAALDNCIFAKDKTENKKIIEREKMDLTKNNKERGAANAAPNGEENEKRKTS